MHSLLTDKQSGYRRNHSTEQQLLYLTHNMYKSLDSGRNFTAIYLDISKYFDKIWHKGLLHKCKHDFGISDSVFNWLKSYLCNRRQRVQINNTFSTTHIINAGCPQGSVLGPLLALMYLDGLPRRTKNDILLFADDTSLYASHTTADFNETQLSLQRDLDEIYKYGREWAITFNTTKTIQQTFSHKQQHTPPALTFGGDPIPIHDSHTHLGIALSTDLRFHQHVNVICKKVNQTLSPLYPIAQYIPRPILDQIYKTYIRPHFDYCDIIYGGNLTLTDANRLQTLQNRCARLVTGAMFRSSTTALLNDLGWERLETRRLIHRLLFFHRLYYNNPPLPSYVTELLTDTRHDTTGLRLRNETHLTIPPIRLTSFHRSYIPATIRQWNLLPSALRDITSRTGFARQVWLRFGVPEPPPLHSYGTKTGNTLHTRLRIGLSKLNAHLFRICHNNTPSPACICGYHSENTIHYILLCPLHNNHRLVLFNDIKTVIPEFDYLSAQNKLDALLLGKNVNKAQQVIIARLFQTFIAHTRRFTPIH